MKYTSKLKAYFAIMEGKISSIRFADDLDGFEFKPVTLLVHDCVKVEETEYPGLLKFTVSAFGETYEEKTYSLLFSQDAYLPVYGESENLPLRSRIFDIVFPILFPTGVIR